MGVTIHYRGQLRDPASLPQLTGELLLACGRLGWPCQEVDERVIGTAEHAVFHEDPDGVTVRATVETTPLEGRWRGLVVEPPDCETLWLTFNRSGQLVVYDVPLEEPETPGRYHVRDQLSIKTQFSTPEVHMAVCSLLRLVEGYAARLEVMDEGDYWESGDRETLAARMEQLDAALAALSSDEGLGLLEEMLGRDVQGPVEVGKRVERRMPWWRRDWGVSAEEN
jgi:hypothetical protein